MVTKKIVKLRIKVPANVTVFTELVHSAATISADPAALKGLSNSPSVMEMDLTSAKTGDWLKKKLSGSADCSNCCCVRG